MAHCTGVAASHTANALPAHTAMFVSVCFSVLKSQQRDTVCKNPVGFSANGSTQTLHQYPYPVKDGRTGTVYLISVTSVHKASQGNLLYQTPVGSCLQDSTRNSVNQTPVVHSINLL